MKHRRRKRKNNKEFKNILIISFILLFTLSAGYSAFQTNINMNAKGNIKCKYFNIEKLKNNVINSGDGLYLDIYETDRYIYKGANPNNFIEFNNEKWRIYSIENDNTLKIIKNDPIEGLFQFDPGYSSSIPGVTEENSLLGTRYSDDTHNYCYVSDSTSYRGCNAWAATSNLVGSPSTFENGTISGEVTEDAYLNKYLNSGEYWTTTLSSDAKRIIYSNSIWNVGPSGRYEYNYTIYELISDSFEKKYKWIGKVGLLTKSEYLRASSYDFDNNTSLCNTESNYWYNSETCKMYNWIYNSSYISRLISPMHNNNEYIGDIRATTGRADFMIAAWSTNTLRVRPVVYLNSNIELCGKGTESNFYKIKSTK